MNDLINKGKIDPLLQEVSKPRYRRNDNMALKLINYVDSLIRENKTVQIDGYHLTIDSLDEYDIEEFTAHLINQDSLNYEGWDFLYYDNFGEELAKTFADYLLSYGDKKDELKNIFLGALTKSASQAMRHRMQNLIEDRLRYVEIEDMEERSDRSEPEDYGDDYD